MWTSSFDFFQEFAELLLCSQPGAQLRDVSFPANPELQLRNGFNGPRVYRLWDLDVPVVTDIAFLLLNKRLLLSLSVHRSLAFPCPSGPGRAPLPANDQLGFLSTLTCAPCLPRRGGTRLPGKNWGGLRQLLGSHWPGFELASPSCYFGMFSLFSSPGNRLPSRLLSYVCQREGLGETRLIALQSEKGKVVHFYV